jgi:hypothetical protein
VTLNGMRKALLAEMNEWTRKANSGIYDDAAREHAWGVYDGLEIACLMIENEIERLHISDNSTE